MTLNETIARLRAAHLMVRDAKEWDELSVNLWTAYQANDEELVEQFAATVPAVVADRHAVRAPGHLRRSRHLGRRTNASMGNRDAHRQWNHQRTTPLPR
ncbi:hypothetical protein [Arthrobacter sp. StoSoilB13]|uniref:hypothetical protein n=1 Tax=Arthrobacter sp. StoSoilB13 TaxID=2830993 RepID=UPI001CC70450|nr:hypothetical protein [Arthrobacter sp. StoSoilB13]